MNQLDIIDDFIGLENTDHHEDVTDALDALTEDEFWEFIIALEASLPKPSSNNSRFRFFGGAEMSGLGLSCTSYTCRRESLASATSFASFYCDELVLYNPISRLFSTSTRTVNIHVPDPIEDLAFHIRELVMLTPLISRNIVTFARYNTQNICHDCLKKAMKIASQYKDASIYASAMNYLVRNSRVYCDSSDRVRELRIEFEKPISHGHEELIVSHDGLSKLKPWRKGARLSEKRIVELNVFAQTAELMTNDIINKQISLSSNSLTTSISHESETRILTDVFGGKNIVKKFDLEFPTLSSRNIEHLLKIRDNEWPHFQDYRNLLFDFEGSPDQLASSIKKEIVELYKLIGKNSRTSKAALIDGAAISAITFASYFASGDISAAVSTAVAAIGAGHFARKMVPALRKHMTEPEEARESQMYLAWKFHKEISE
jgi:hypothetical protein